MKVEVTYTVEYKQTLDVSPEEYLRDRADFRRLKQKLDLDENGRISKIRPETYEDELEVSLFLYDRG